MAGWIASLSAWGLQNADIVTTHSLLAPGVDAFEGADEFLFRANGRAFALDRDAPRDLVQALSPAPATDVHGETLAELLGVPPSSSGAPTREAWLITLAEAYEAAEAGQVISLRQGAYAIRRQMNFNAAGRWRAIGALAAAACVLWLADVWMETAAYKSQTTDLRNETLKIVNGAVPSANGNVAAALNTLRQQQQVAGVMLRPTIASAALYEALEPTSNAEIRSVRFDASTGNLIALVLFENFADADAIGARLEANGLAVQLGEARQSGGRVLGEFTIGVAS